MFKNKYKGLMFFAFLQAMLMPFMSFSQRFIVENGGGGKTKFEQEQEELVNKLVEKFDGKVNQAIKGLITGEQLEEHRKKLMSEIADKLPDDKLKNLENIMETQGKIINDIKARFEGPEAKESLKDLIIKNHEAILEVAESKGVVKLQLKTDVLRANVTDHTLAMRLAEIGQIAYAATNIQSIFRSASVSPNSNSVIRYVDQSSVTRNADTRDEAALFPESAIEWQEYTLNIQKIADSIPVSYEAMNDVDFIESEIMRLLEVNMALKVEQQLLLGDGVAPNLKGLFTSAPVFNSGAYTGYTPTAATLYDLIAIMRTEIANGKESKYMPTHVILNPADLLRMKLAKDAENNYILPPFIAGDGTRVDGVIVIENPTVVANTLVIGDFRYGTVYNLDGVTIEMGWIDDQFTKDMMTIKARQRMALLIRNADVDAFLQSEDITTDIANISAP